jgi:voltage-gated potassium channel
VSAASFRAQAERLLAAHAFEDGDPEALVRLLGRCQPRRAGTGEVLCRQGEPGDEVLFLLEGRVSVLKNDAEGRPREIGQWFAPAIIGAPAVVENTTRSATCVAGAPVSLVVLGGRAARALLREDSPEAAHFRWLLLASLTEGLANVRDRLRESGGAAPTLDELHAAVERTHFSRG